MQDPRISRDMKFEDWHRWRNGGKGDGSDSYEIRPYIHDGLLYADSIGKLRYLAVNGSRSAALFLKRYYSEGPLVDPTQAYKYACYSALAGDEETIEEFRSQGKAIDTFFLEDEPFVDFADLRTEFHGGHQDFDGMIIAPYPFEYWELPGDEDFNSGYRHPHSFGLYFVFETGRVLPDVLTRHGGYRDTPLKKNPYRPWPTYEDLAECPSENRDDMDRRFYRDVRLYFGIGIERDEGAAMRDLLALVGGGYRNAADMISYAIGYEPSTFLARYPDDVHDDTYWELHPIADWKMLEDSPEWRILMMVAGFDEKGVCQNPERRNGYGGYEDDVLCTRPKECDSGRAKLIFKPSGYTAGWRGRSWRSSIQNENLSMGEIRMVLRLCIEHLVYRREIPEGPTKELILAPMHLYVPSADAEAFMLEAARKAASNRIGWKGTNYNAVTFDWVNGPKAEKEALKIIDRPGPFFWDSVKSCIESYARFHEISFEEASDILVGIINNDEFREEAAFIGHMNLARLMAVLRGRVEDSGGTNPPLKLPKMDGNYEITELPSYFED